MDCPDCGVAAPDGARFCGQCGAALVATARRDALDDLILDYQRELKDKPGNTTALYNLAVALQRKGRLDEALRAWKSLAAFEPGFDEARAAIQALEARKEGST